MDGVKESKKVRSFQFPIYIKKPETFRQKIAVYSALSNRYEGKPLETFTSKSFPKVSMYLLSQMLMVSSFLYIGGNRKLSTSHQETLRKPHGN